MSDPGLLQELPNIPLLLSQAGGDREQAATADSTAGGLDAMAVARHIPDFALNDRLAQGSLGSVVGRLDAVDLQEGSQGFFAQ